MNSGFKVKFDVLSSYLPTGIFASLSTVNVYLVGGPVRDFLLNKDFFDIDLVVERWDDKFIENLILALTPQKVSRSGFLTLKIILRSFEVDIAHAREEFYDYPGALPRVIPSYDILCDLKRRDFTVNSMAIRIYPQPFTLIDQLDGYGDLRSRILRVNKRDSFKDDPTRSFRAIRYKHRLNLKYSYETLREFENARYFIRNVSFERIRRELQKIAKEKKRVDIFLEISDSGILSSWDQRFSFGDKTLLTKLDEFLPYEERYWLFFLLPFGILNYFERNPDKFTSAEKKSLQKILRKKPAGKFSPGSLYKILKDMTPEEVKVWGLLNDIDERVINEYLKQISSTVPVLGLKDILRFTDDPLKARLAYETYVSMLIDGKVPHGKDEEIVKKILKKIF
ncbi:MAG: hypothetical protein ABIM43_01895 [candidate division WOR-3 bacterium]